MDARLQRASDEELLRARRHADLAFAAFYRRHVAHVLSYVRGRGVDAHVAADVVSGTFLAALKARRRYEPSTDSALPWLIAIASRQLLDVNRQNARQDRITRRFIARTTRDLDPQDVASYDSVDPRSVAIDEALRVLPDEQQLAIAGRVIGDLEYPELAARLGVSEATARQRVSRGLRSVRGRFPSSNEEQHDA